jgi:adenylate cyclase
MNISNRSKKKLKTLAAVIMIASLAAGVFNLLTVEKSLGPFAQGVIDGFFISLLLGGYLLFIAQGYLTNFFRNLNFTTTLLINSGVLVFLFLSGRFVGNYVTDLDVAFLTREFFTGNFYYALGLAFFLSVSINFVIQMNRLVGQNVLKNFISGTYHKPKEEKRFFMFLDLESSTRIAENLGDKKFHSLLSMFFYDLTDAVLETDGEIYEYVGDEVVVTWKHAKGLKNSNCLRCFFLIKKQIDKNSETYLREFGLTPDFRAGLHGGTVVAGELGDVRQKIGFVGDVLNSTARIRDYCREKNRRFLVSDRIIDQIQIPEKFLVEDMGDFQPRGKQKSFRIYSVAEKP